MNKLTANSATKKRETSSDSASNNSVLDHNGAYIGLDVRKESSSVSVATRGSRNMPVSCSGTVHGNEMMKACNNAIRYCQLPI